MKTTATTIIDILLTIAFICVIGFVLSVIAFFALLLFIQYAFVLMIEHGFAFGIGAFGILTVLILIAIYKLIRRMIRG